MTTRSWMVTARWLIATAATVVIATAVLALDATSARAQKAAVLVGGPVLPETREVIAAAARGRIVDQRWKLVETPPMPEMDLHDIVTCLTGKFAPECTGEVRGSTPIDRLLVLSARNEGGRTSYSTVVAAWLVDGGGRLIIAKSKICEAHCKPGFLETAVNDLVSSLLREAEERLKPTVLAIRSTPEGADIEINDKVVGVTNRDHPVAPGSYRVVLRKKGWKPATRDVVAVERETVPVEVALEADDTTSVGTGRNPLIGIVGTGVGAVLLGAGIYFVVQDEDESDGIDEGHGLRPYTDTAPLGYALGGVGIAAAAGGLAWLFLPRGDDDAGAVTQVGVTDRGLWLGYGGRF